MFPKLTADNYLNRLVKLAIWVSWVIYKFPSIHPSLRWLLVSKDWISWISFFSQESQVIPDIVFEYFIPNNAVHLNARFFSLFHSPQSMLSSLFIIVIIKKAGQGKSKRAMPTEFAFKMETGCFLFPNSLSWNANDRRIDEHTSTLNET